MHTQHHQIRTSSPERRTERARTVSLALTLLAAGAAVLLLAPSAIGRPRTLAGTQRALVQTNWAQFRFGLERTGFNPLETVISPANVSHLERDWIANAGATVGAAVSASPAIANGVVYIGSN